MGAAVAQELKLPVSKVAVKSYMEKDYMHDRGGRNIWHTELRFKGLEAIALGYKLEKAVLANTFHPIPSYPIHRLYMEEVFDCGPHAVGATHTYDGLNDKEANIKWSLPDKGWEVTTPTLTELPTQAPPSKFGAGKWLVMDAAGNEYINTWDRPFLTTCPAGEAVTKIHSVHSDKKEDRRWKLGCAALIGKGVSSVTGATRWLPYNDWDAEQNQKCGDQEFMTGLKGHHSNYKEDRQYSIQCTKVESNVGSAEVVKKHSWQGWANNLDGALNWSCPTGQALVGMASIHSNGKEDRRYKFMCGSMVSSHR